MEGFALTDQRPFLISNGTFQHVLAPVSPSNDQGNRKIKKKIMILRKGARGLPNTMKIAQTRKNLALYGMVHLDKQMSEEEVRSEVAKKFFKLDDVGYKFGAADKFGRLNFHEDEEWTATNIGKWAKKASVLYIVPEVELDDASDDSDDSSDESNRRPVQRLTAEVKSEPVVLASLPSFHIGQPAGDPKVLSKGHCGYGAGQLRDSAISGSSHDETMEVDSVPAVTNQPSIVSTSEGFSPSLQNDFLDLDIDTVPLWDPFEGDYFNMLYADDMAGTGVEEQGGVSQPLSHGIPQGVPPGKQKPVSPAGTSTSSGIEEDKSDSSASLEPAEPEQLPMPINYISEMSPDSGPMKGGSKFMMLLEQDLPGGIDFPLRVKFGNIPDGTVDAFLKNHALTGNRIPASPVPGAVRVVVETQCGQYIGETEYTYEEEDKKAVLLEAVSTCDPKVLSELFYVLAGRMKSFAVNNDGSPADGNIFLQQLGGGHSEGNTQNQILDMLEVMIYLAAQVDGQQFVKIIFNTPVGKVLFNSYKDKSTQPQDIARENGHHEIAQYLDDIQQRFQQSDQDYPEDIEQIDWESVIQAVQKLTDDQNRESELFTVQLCVEESDDDYGADDEATFSSSSDDEERVLTVNKDPAYVLALRKLRTTSHPNILSLFASGSVPSSFKVFAQRETLVVHLQNFPQTNSESLINIAHDITSALSYLQCIGVVHRDIRAENVLITNSLCQLAITKTVRALDCKEQQSQADGDHNHMPDEPGVPEYIFREVYGTPAYMAPECISEGRFSIASDVFSFGCLLFELLTSNQLHGSSPNDILQAIPKAKVKEKEYDFCKEERISNDIYSLVESCWKDDRRERPSPCEILKILDKIRNETIIQDDDCVPSLDPVNHPDAEPVPKPINQIELMMESFEEPSKVPTALETPTDSVANDEDNLPQLTGRTPALSTQRVSSQSLSHTVSLSERQFLETKVSSTPERTTLSISENDSSQHRDKRKPSSVLPRINISEEFSNEIISSRGLESPGLEQEAHSSARLSGDNCKPVSYSNPTKFLLVQSLETTNEQQNRMGGSDGEKSVTDPTASNDTSWKADKPWITAIKPGTADNTLCRTTDQPGTAISKPGTTDDSSWATKDQSWTTISNPGTAADTPCITRDKAWTTGSKLDTTDNSLWTTKSEPWTTASNSGTTGDTCKTTTDCKQCTTTNKLKVASKRSRVAADKDKASKEPYKDGVKIAEESHSEEDRQTAGFILRLRMLSLVYFCFSIMIVLTYIVALLSWFAAAGDSTSFSSGKHNTKSVTTGSNYERGSASQNFLNCFSDLRHFVSCCFPMQHATALHDLKKAETSGQKLPYSLFVNAFVNAPATMKSSTSNCQIQTKQVNQTTRRPRRTKFALRQEGCYYAQRVQESGCTQLIRAKYWTVIGNPGHGKTTIAVNQLRTRLCWILCTTLDCRSIGSYSRTERTNVASSSNNIECSEIVELPSTANSGVTTNKVETLHRRSGANNQQQHGVGILTWRAVQRLHELIYRHPETPFTSKLFYKRFADSLNTDLKYLMASYQICPQSGTQLNECRLHQLLALSTPLIPSFTKHREPEFLKDNNSEPFATYLKYFCERMYSVLSGDITLHSWLNIPSAYTEEFMRYREGLTSPKRPTESFQGARRTKMTVRNLLKILSETKENRLSDAGVYNCNNIYGSCKNAPGSGDLQKHFKVFFQRCHQSDTKLNECGLHHISTLLTQRTRMITDSAKHSSLNVCDGNSTLSFTGCKQTNKETNSAPNCDKGCENRSFCPARTRHSDLNKQIRLFPSPAYIKGSGINKQSKLASYAITTESMRHREGETCPRRPTGGTATAKRFIMLASRGLCTR